MPEIILARPVRDGDREYAKIELDEPTVGGIEAFEKARAKGEGEVTAMIAMLEFDTGMPASAIRKIKASDLVKISDAFAPFVTGATAPSGPSGER